LFAWFPSHHEHTFLVKQNNERMFDFVPGSGYTEITWADRRVAGGTVADRRVDEEDAWLTRN
jgi:hypothetical protein